jgi:hypothetical protein
MNRRPGILKYIFLYLCSFLWILALLSIVMFQSPSFYGPFLSALMFILMANFSLAECIAHRKKAKASGASLPWWKEWNNLLFIFGLIMGIVGYFINWLVGLSFRTVWVFLVGLVLVGFSAILYTMPGSEGYSTKEGIRALIEAEFKDFEKHEQK